MWFELFSLAVTTITGWISYRLIFIKERTHGPNAVSIDSFWLRLKYFLRAPSVLLESYKKYRDKTFFFTTFRKRHQIVVTSDDLVWEHATASQSVLSSSAWVRYIVQMDYTLPGHYIDDKPPPCTVTNFRYLNVSLTRKVANFIPGLQEEVLSAIQKIKAKTSSEALTIPLFELAQDILVRSSMRVLVGKPLCYDQEFIDAMEAYIPAVMAGGFLVSLFPEPLKWFVVNHFTGIRKPETIIKNKLRALSAEHAVKIQADIDKLGADEASKQWDEHGDLFTELVRAALTRQKFNIEDSIIQVMGTTFAANHTTVFTITTTVAELSIRQEYHDDLRAEIATCVAKHGWTQAGLNAMSKLDSFIMESMRHRPINSTTMNRIALSEFKFSDGTTVHPGDYVAAISESRLRNVDDDKHEFRGFQHHEARLRGASTTKFTSIDDLSWPLFGHGNHPCPGRFWADLLVKLVIAHLLESFDFPEGVNHRPPRRNFEENSLPLNGVKLTVKLRS